MLKGLFFSQLRKFDVIDVNRRRMGHVGDLLLKKDNFDLNSIIVYGSYIEEKMEALGLKEDIDPIVKMDQIDETNLKDQTILTFKPEHRLSATHNNWIHPDDVYQMSKLRKLIVIDKNGNNVGHIIDILFHDDGNKTLVISSSKFREFLENIRLGHYQDYMVPIDLIENIDNTTISLNISKVDLIQDEKLSLKNLISKDFKSIEKPLQGIGCRYQYIEFEADYQVVIDNLSKRSEKIVKSLKELIIVPFDPLSKSQTQDFVNIFNEVAVTGVDPYEEMTPELVKKHFSSSSLIVYRFTKPIGYCIMTWKIVEERKIGAIAGIGINVKNRGKGFSTALMKYTLEYFNKTENFDALQSDILVSNEASIGLFTHLGFQRINEFYLCS